MNKYESIIGGGVDTLVRYALKTGGFRCEWCVFKESDNCRGLDDCAFGIKAWLLSEAENEDGD